MVHSPLPPKLRSSRSRPGPRLLAAALLAACALVLGACVGTTDERATQATDAAAPDVGEDVAPDAGMADSAPEGSTDAASDEPWPQSWCPPVGDGGCPDGCVASGGCQFDMDRQCFIDGGCQFILCFDQHEIPPAAPIAMQDPDGNCWKIPLVPVHPYGDLGWTVGSTECMGSLGDRPICE